MAMPEDIKLLLENLKNTPIHLGRKCVDILSKDKEGMKKRSIFSCSNCNNGVCEGKHPTHHNIALNEKVRHFCSKECKNEWISKIKIIKSLGFFFKL